MLYSWTPQANQGMMVRMVSSFKLGAKWEIPFCTQSDIFCLESAIYLKPRWRILLFVFMNVDRDWKNRPRSRV